MKFQALAALLALAVSSNAHNNVQQRHARIAAKRDTSSAAGSSTSSASVVLSASASSTAAVAASTSAGATGTSVAGTSAAAGTSVAAGTPAAGGGTTIPPLSSISSGMPSGATIPVTATYTSGSTPTYYSAASGLPTPFVFSSADWPAQDKLPDTSSEEVQEWLKELDGWDIPDISPTVDGTCGSDPSNAANASSRGWWTCGGYTRDTDIVACPDKMTWGLSFDDGPSPFSKRLLSFLDQKDILGTFFVVGSRVIERPDVLREEYMSGHEISVHTWSHPHLTTLTNEQIVAELGWTRKAIKEVLGVTPTTMRPPYGDIDDRVRAISLAMGMVPIIWTRTEQGYSFDTFDWMVAGGLVTSSAQIQQFESILGNATVIDSGFIVLEHDLFEITVDLAIGYTLPAALNHEPPFTLKPIGQCSNIPYTNMYLESNVNSSFPVTSNTGGGIDTDGDGTTDVKSKANSTTSGASSNGKNAATPQLGSAPMFSTLSLVGLALLGSML